MSIYSGFATRFQEESYDHCIDSLLYILQKRIIKFYQNQQADQEKFISLVLKLHQQMKNMEKNKYLDPKSSLSVNELIKFMQLYQQNIISHNIQPQPEKQAESEQQLPTIEHKSSLPEVTIQKKKKSLYWVEKNTSEKQQNKNITQQQQIVTGSLQKGNQKNESRQKDKRQFKRTNYQPASRDIKTKQTSRTNIQRKQQKPKAMQTKNKSTSNYTHERHKRISPLVHFTNNIHIEPENNILHRRRSKSNAKGLNHQPDINSQRNSEVADIIKEYIIKAKKNYLKGNRNKQYQAKLHDF